MSTHNASIADLEATEHFEDGIARGGDDITDEHSHGHFDEIDVFGSLAPAVERTHSWTGETSGPHPAATHSLSVASLAAGALGLTAGASLVLGAAGIALAAMLWTGAPTAVATAEVQAPTARGETEEIAVAEAAITEAAITEAAAAAAREPELADVLVIKPHTVPLNFAHNSFQALSGPDFDQFAGALQEALRAPGRALTLTGHTDSTGSAEANLTMGLGRAWAVQVALIAKGLNHEQITLASAGEAQPVADNRTADGRAANRRVVATVWAQ